MPASVTEQSVTAFDEHARLRSLQLAATACSMLRTYEIPPTPSHYRVAYTHASASKSALSAEINQTVLKTGKVTATDFEGLHARYFPECDDGAIDEIGVGISQEVEKLSRLVATSLKDTQAFGDSLKDTIGDTSQIESHNLEAIVAFLRKETSRMQQSNQAASERLKSHIEQVGSLRRTLNAARAESCTDALTELSNRKEFDRLFSIAVDDSATRRRPLSLLLIDIDHFKAFNDRYGHLTGDQVLRLVGASIRQMIKGQDIAARYGGEEFAVALPSTGMKNSIGVAESIRRDIAARKLKKKSSGEVLGQISVSVGIAELRNTDTCESLIERADACLYAAKRAGRNRVLTEDESELEGDL